MKMKLNFLSVGLCAVAIAGAFSAPGCGAASDSNAAANVADAKTVEKVKTMRSIFDKVHGDYSQLSPEDKDTYTKLAGGDAKAQQLWDVMKNGPSRTGGNPGQPAGR
jgi:hypothetical protein